MGGNQARRQRNPRGQGERLRDDIIDAASRLLEDPAGPPLSLRAVAREVGVAATSVYLHFDDIESLVRAVASRRFTDLIRAQDAARADLDDPCDRLRAACLMYCEFGLAHPGHYQVTFTNPLPVGGDVPWEQMPGQKAWEHFVEGVAPCIGRAPDDPEAVRTALLLAATAWDREPADLPGPVPLAAPRRHRHRSCQPPHLRTPPRRRATARPSPSPYRQLTSAGPHLCTA